MILCHVIRQRRTHIFCHWITYFYQLLPHSCINSEHSELFATQHVSISFSVLMYELGCVLFKLCHYVISLRMMIFMGIHSTLCTFLLCTFTYAHMFNCEQPYRICKMHRIFHIIIYSDKFSGKGRRGKILIKF